MKTILRSLAPLAVAAAIAAVTAGCVFGQPMTPEEIAQYGTKSFPAPKAKVFKAALASLKSEGFEIAYEDVGKGLIKTAPKMIGAVGSANQATGTYRQYTLNVTVDGDKTKVVATPRVAIGQNDVSEQSVWRLDGPAGERTLWSKLFKEIEELM